MAIFFTSDQHFGHERILELGDGRPFKTIGEHNDYIVRQWFHTVQPDDVVYVLGDVAFGGGEAFVKNVSIFSWLPGVKFLIPGNHDKIWSGNTVKYRERYEQFYVDAGFTVLSENFVLDFPHKGGTVPVMLSHVPYVSTMEVTDGARAGRFKKQTPEDEGLPLIHGHTHSRSKLHSHLKSFHVGVDAHGFTPVSEGEISDWLDGVL